MHAVEVTASGEHASMPLGLTADTVHTIAVLDGSSGLKAVALTDAVGTKVMPAGGAATGLGGTASRPAADMVPWLLVLAGALLAAAGAAGLAWPRRAAATHR